MEEIPVLSDQERAELTTSLQDAEARVKAGKAIDYDPKTHTLVCLGALLATHASPSSYQASVEVALAAGASADEIVGTLVAVAPAIGLGRVVSAAPDLALALGYDVDAALEAHQ